MAEEYIPVAVAVAALVVASGVAVWYYWPKIKRKLKGKTLLLLGQRQTGKSTMAHLIEHDTLPPGTKDTKIDRKFKTSNLKFKEINLKLFWDMPGGPDAKIQHWEKALIDSDVVFYLVKADLCLKNDKEHLGRIKQDIDSIRDWLQGDKMKGRDVKVIIVATHEDKVVLNYSNVQDALGSLEAYRMAVKSLSPDVRRGPVVGSLASREAGKDLIFRALKEAL